MSIQSRLQKLDLKFFGTETFRLGHLHLAFSSAFVHRLDGKPWSSPQGFTAGKRGVCCFPFLLMSIDQLGKLSHSKCFQNICIPCLHNIFRVTHKEYTVSVTPLNFSVGDCNWWAHFSGGFDQPFKSWGGVSWSEIKISDWQGPWHEPEKNQVQRVSRFHSCVMFVLPDLSLPLKRLFCNRRLNNPAPFKNHGRISELRSPWFHSPKCKIFQ